MNSKWLKHRVKLSLSKLGFAALIMLIVPLNTSAASIKPYEMKAVYLLELRILFVGTMKAQ